MFYVKVTPHPHQLRYALFHVAVCTVHGFSGDYWPSDDRDEGSGGHGWIGL